MSAPLRAWPKLRQQLQVLRDYGYLDFTGRGSYRLRSVP
ncbi:MAG TPA: hypothetical protein VKB16_17780 [Beijerinckiaceae bacterium]|nr:hypothetical protein [Beijerinckiaceae bacterium]